MLAAELDHPASGFRTIMGRVSASLKGEHAIPSDIREALRAPVPSAWRDIGISSVDRVMALAGLPCWRCVARIVKLPAWGLPRPRGWSVCRPGPVVDALTEVDLRQGIPLVADGMLAALAQVRYPCPFDVVRIMVEAPMEPADLVGLKEDGEATIEETCWRDPKGRDHRRVRVRFPGRGLALCATGGRVMVRLTVGKYLRGRNDKLEEISEDELVGAIRGVMATYLPRTLAAAGGAWAITYLEVTKTFSAPVEDLLLAYRHMWPRRCRKRCRKHDNYLRFGSSSACLVLYGKDRELRTRGHHDLPTDVERMRAEMRFRNPGDQAWLRALLPEAKPGERSLPLHRGRGMPPFMAAVRFDAFHLALRCRLEELEGEEEASFFGMQRRTLLGIVQGAVERGQRWGSKRSHRLKSVACTQVAKRLTGLRLASLAYLVSEHGSLQAMLVSTRMRR